MTPRTFLSWTVRSAAPMPSMAILALPLVCGGALLAGCGEDGAPSTGATAVVRDSGGAPARQAATVASARKARRAARRACGADRPGAVIEAHLPRARRLAHGRGPELLELVSERRGELHGRALSDVAARVYALSRPVAVRDAAYRGCRSVLDGAGS